MQVMVLGSESLIGQEIYKIFFENDHVVTPVDEFGSEKLWYKGQPDPGKTVPVNIEEYEVIENAIMNSDCSLVINCIEDTSNSDERIYNKNILGVINLINACNKKNIKLIHCSTYAINKQNSIDLRAYESDISIPMGNKYVTSKFTAEELIKSMSKDYLIVRLPELFGINPNCKFIKTLRTSYLKPIINYPESTSFVNFGYAKHIAEAIYSLQSCTGIINVFNPGAPFTIKDFYSKVFSELGINCEIHELDNCIQGNYIMSNDRLNKEGIKLKSASDALDEFLKSESTAINLLMMS